MAIEIVDLPIKSGDCPSFFCMFTRGYLQGWNDFVPSVSPSSRHPGPPYPSGGGKRHFRPPRPWTTWYHWNMAFTNVIQWRVANIGFTSQELLNCNSWLYVCIRDIYICVCVCIYVYIYSNGSRVATTNREVRWSAKPLPPLFHWWCRFTGQLGDMESPGLSNEYTTGWWYTMVEPYLSLWKMMEWKSVDDDIANIWENNPNVIQMFQTTNQKRDLHTKSWGYSRIYSVRVNHEASPFFPISFPPNWDHNLVNYWRLELSLDSKSGMEHRWFEYCNHK